MYSDLNLRYVICLSDCNQILSFSTDLNESLQHKVSQQSIPWMQDDTHGWMARSDETNRCFSRVCKHASRPPPYKNTRKDTRATLTVMGSLQGPIHTLVETE
jgi:hypothetical protein